MLTLRIFISSPGDVAEERAAVRRVTTELEGSHLLRGKVHFQIIAWDDPHAASPMEAGVTPQDSVGLAAKLNGAGIDMGQIPTLGHEIFGYAEEKVGPEKLREIVDSIPGIAQFV